MEFMMDIIEVFEAGSTLALNGGMTAIVEKAIIGAGMSVQYQVICYAPERHPQVVNDFEVSPVEGKVTKRSIGFAQVVEPDKKEVTILIDENNAIVDIDAPSEVLVGTMTLTDTQVEEYRQQRESPDGKTEEKTEEGEKEAE